MCSEWRLGLHACICSTRLVLQPFFKLEIPKFQIPIPAPCAPCKLDDSQIPNSNPCPASAPCKLEIPTIPNSNPSPSAPCKLSLPWQIPKFLIPIPHPKAPKAKSFRIPRVRRLKLQFPYMYRILVAGLSHNHPISSRLSRVLASTSLRPSPLSFTI